MTEHPDDVAGDILRAVRRLTRATAVLYIVVLGLIVAMYVDSGNKADNLAKVAEETSSALCAFRTDVEARAEQTEQFLADHPNGFAGVPVAQLRQSLEGQRRTVKSLQSLDCPAPDLP